MEHHTRNDMILPGKKCVASATLRVEVYALWIVEIGRFR